MKKFSKKINKFLALIMCSVILFQSSMISVYAAVNANEEDLLQALEDLSPELQEIVRDSISELYLTLLTTDDETKDLLESIVSELDALTENMESKLEASDQSFDALLTIINAYETEITEVITPYVTETTENYVGEVLALLLTEVEASLLIYAEDLEAKLMESVETVINESILDIIINLTGNADATDEEITEFIEAYQNLINNNVEADYEAYTAATDAVTEYLSSDNLASELESALSDALATANYETLKEKITTDYINGIFSGYTSSYDMDAIYELVWNNNVSYNTIEAEFEQQTCNSLGWCSGGSYIQISGYVGLLNTAINGVSLVSNLTSDETDDVTDEVYDDDENLQSLLTNQAQALTTLTESVSSLIDDINTVSDFMGLEFDTTDLLTNLISGEVSVDSIIDSISVDTTNISFVIEAIDLTTEFITAIESSDADSATLMTNYVTNLNDLIEEYDMQETVQNIIEDIIENIEEEFTSEYFEEIILDFTEALEDGIESFSELLGTDGYPALPSEMLEEMYETVLEYLKEVDVDAEYDELISALEEVMSTEVIEEIMLNIYEELSSYENVLELTLEELIDIIVTETLDKITDLINDYFAEDEITEIVDNNTTTTIIPDNIVSDYIENKEDLTIENSGLEITVNQNALLEIQTTVGANSFSIVVEDETDTYELLNELILLVGNRSIYTISLIDENGESVELTDGSLTIKLPYELADGEYSESVVLFDAVSGESIQTTYEDGYITFTTSVLSTYAIGYVAVGGDLEEDDATLEEDVVVENLEKEEESSTSGNVVYTDTNTSEESEEENDSTEETEDTDIDSNESEEDESSVSTVENSENQSSNTGIKIVLSLICLLLILLITKKVYDEQTKE